MSDTSESLSPFLHTCCIRASICHATACTRWAMPLGTCVVSCRSNVVTVFTYNGLRFAASALPCCPLGLCIHHSLSRWFACARNGDHPPPRSTAQTKTMATMSTSHIRLLVHLRRHSHTTHRAWRRTRASTSRQRGATALASAWGVTFLSLLVA
jgi:hypothetical protein